MTEAAHKKRRRPAVEPPPAAGLADRLRGEHSRVHNERNRSASTLCNRQVTRKRMIGKRLYSVWLLGLALLISSCGGSTPPDAVIKAVEPNKTTTYSLVTVPVPVTDGAIHFKVQISPTDVTPAGGVVVELSGSSPSVADPAAGFVGGVSGGGFVNAADPNHIVETTNGSGVVSAFYQFTVPKCSTTDDLSVTASILASIGGSTAIWTDNITVKKDPTC